MRQFCSVVVLMMYSLARRSSSTRACRCLIATLLSLALPVSFSPAQADGAGANNTGNKAERCKTGLRVHSSEVLAGKAADAVNVDHLILRAIVNEAGCRLQPIDTRGTNAHRQQLLRDGALEIITVASYRPERDSYAWFSPAYRNEQIRLFIPSYRADEIRVDSIDTLRELPWRIIATQSYHFGAAFEAIRDELRARGKLVEIDDTRAGVRLLLAGAQRGDMLIDEVILVRNQLGSRDNRVTMLPLVAAEDPVYFMFSKRTVSEGLFRELNAAFERLNARGAIRELLARYQLEHLALDGAAQPVSTQPADALVRTSAADNTPRHPDRSPSAHDAVRR